MAVPKTSTTLLRVIGSNPQSERWREFVEKYESFMISCIRAKNLNINDDEMCDVLQNILIKLMRILPNYRYDPEAEGKGYFHNYLFTICRYTANEFVRKRNRVNDRMEFRSDVETLHNESAEEFLATDVERFFVEDWKEKENKNEEDEWQNAVLEIALRELMADPKIQPSSKEIFRLVAISGEKSPEEVAKMFNTTRNNVDQIKNRMMGKLRTLAHKLKHLDSVEI